MKTLKNTLSANGRGARLVVQTHARQETWAASQARMQLEEKELMARYFAEHDFLLSEGSNPAAATRQTAATILINQGTEPNVIAGECLRWIEEHSAAGPFHIIWYSPGALVPATLAEFRQRNPHLCAATHVHLFPGTVDLQLQAQIGFEAQEYARSIRRRFSYLILSGHSFDLCTGVVRFHFDREIPIQKICALREATQKFLFLDSEKFTGEGAVGYSLWELLSTSDAVILYTVSSTRSQEIKAAFERLAAGLLTTDVKESTHQKPKSLRLVIVGQGSVPTEPVRRTGYLKPSSGGENGNGSYGSGKCE